MMFVMSNIPYGNHEMNYCVWKYSESSNILYKLLWPIVKFEKLSKLNFIHYGVLNVTFGSARNVFLLSYVNIKLNTRGREKSI